MIITFDKPIYTIYRTEFPETGEYYIGVHKTKKLKHTPDGANLTHTDGYQGSGVQLKKKKSVHKHIVTRVEDIFFDEHDAYLSEAKRVTYQEVMNPMCLNTTLGGGLGKIKKRISLHKIAVLCLLIPIFRSFLRLINADHNYNEFVYPYTESFGLAIIYIAHAQ